MPPADSRRQTRVASFYHRLSSRAEGMCPVGRCVSFVHRPANVPCTNRLRAFAGRTCAVAPQTINDAQGRDVEIIVFSMRVGLAWTIGARVSQLAVRVPI